MRLLLLAGTAMLTSCGDELSPQQRAREDAMAVAMVEKANRGSAMPIMPEPILYPDIEKYEIFGTSCAFAPEGGGLAAVAIAMREDGFMKIDGDMLRFSADSGSKALPYDLRSQYDGRKYTFELKLEDGPGRPTAAESVNYDGHLTVRDELERVVYDKAGIVQCGS